MPDKEGMRLGGIILTGGRSERMGRPKESLPIADTTLLGWQCLTLLTCTDPVVVVARDRDQTLPPLPAGVERVDDDRPGDGPLAAITTGLQHLQDRHGLGGADAALAVGCDQPFVTAAIVHWLRARLGRADVLMPRAFGKLQPLGALYRLTMLPIAHALLAGGTRSPRDVLARCDGRVLEEAELRAHDHELRWLRNLNEPDDYERARSELEPR